MAGEEFAGHTTHYLHNDTLWFFEWNSNGLNCFDLLHDNLHTYSLDKEISGGTGNLGEMNDMIGDAGGQHLWICSSNYGILMISKKGQLLKKYDGRQLSISNNNIRDLELRGNELWFGCDEGLGVLNTSTGKTVIYKYPAIMNNGDCKTGPSFLCCRMIKEIFISAAIMACFGLTQKPGLFTTLQKNIHWRN
jgi:streptogramin lyase